MIEINQINAFGRVQKCWVKKDDSFGEEPFPIYLRQCEITDIAITSLLPILKGISAAPSEEAGLSPLDIVSPVIHRIDEAYHRTLNDYQADLAKASQEDLKEKEGAVLGNFGIALIGLTTAIGIISVMSAYVFTCMGMWVGNAFAVDYFQRFYTKRQGSIHRIQWLHKVNLAEKQRLQQAKELLSNAIVIVEEPSDPQQRKSLEQLKQLFSRLFPKEAYPHVKSDSLPNVLSNDGQGNEYRPSLENRKVPSSNFNEELLFERPFDICFEDKENKIDLLLSRTPSKENFNALIHRFKGNDQQVSFPLNKEEITLLERQFEVVQKLCEEKKALPLEALSSMALAIREKASKGPLNEEDLLHLVAIGRLAMRIKFQRYPHPVQVMTVLAQLLFKKGALAQVKTGEGKSMIVALLAFVLSMQNKNTHIVSSSRSLADRDQRAFSGFFEAFGVATSSICTDSTATESFQAQILYGTASDFEFAVMREMLEGKQLFIEPPSEHPTHCRFPCVIVDEVDNLLIDTALNSARLSFSAEESYEWIYAPLVDFVKSTYTSNQEFKPADASRVIALKKYLQEYLGERYHERLVRLEDEQLRKWVDKAFTALFRLNENKDYIIASSKLKEGDLERSIKIVDADNTGRIMQGSRWSKGLHEFVEVKHKIKVEKENLIPISMSHAVFYNMYHTLYGLTGTLGSSVEREEINAIYAIDSFDVPTHHVSKRVDQPTLILPSDVDQLEEIKKRVIALRNRGRPALILCETIYDSQKVQAFLRASSLVCETLNEVQVKEEADILAEAGQPGAVTIATNTAGRGTDIKLVEECIKKGGLHVILTFFADSLRVEQQAKGRASRQGEPGSTETILSAEKLGFQNLSDLTDANRQQELLDRLVKQRQTRSRVMKHIHIYRAELERYCWLYVHKFFHNLAPLKESSKDATYSKEELIRNWSLQFYQKAEQAIQNSRLQQYAPHLEATFQKMIESGRTEAQTETFLREYENVLTEACMKEFNSIKEYMDDLFKEISSALLYNSSPSQ